MSSGDSGPPVPSKKMRLRQCTLFELKPGLPKDPGQGQTDQLSFLGLPVLFNPPKDGNCQFEAAAHQLRNIGCIVSANACREAAVEWISRNESKLREFTATDKKKYFRKPEQSDNTDEIWNRYVKNMSKNGTFGDNLTLMGIANKFEIQWIIISTSSDEHCLISDVDVYQVKRPTLVLGYDVVNLHYVIQMTKWASKSNVVLKSYLDTCATYLSPTIQNELIQCLENEVRSQLVTKCNQSLFCSVMADETTDCSTVEQVSICVRYLKSSNGSQFEVCEDFLGFAEVKNTTAETIADTILSKLRLWGVDVSKLRGKGFDGASNMSGHISGVQARIQLELPAAK